MKFSAGVVLTLLVSPSSTFVQRPSLVFQAQRPTFRQDRRSSRSLQAVGIVDVFTAIAADPEVSAAVGSSLSLLDLAVFLVPLTALGAGATAISQRDLIRSEIDTTERTLAETKSLLEKSDQTIKISFVTAAATFALAFAYELGAISIPETPSSSVSSSSSGVSTVTKADSRVPATKAPSEIASPKAEETQKPAKAAVKTEKPKVAGVPSAGAPVPGKGPDNYDALFDKLTSSKSEETSETKEATTDAAIDQPKEKDAAAGTITEKPKEEVKEEISEQNKEKEGVMDSLLPKLAEKPKDDGNVETKAEAVRESPKEVLPEQIKEQGGVVNSLMSKVSEAKENKETASEQSKEKEGVVDSLMSKLSDKPKEETPKEVATEQTKLSDASNEKVKEVTKSEESKEVPKADAAKAETQEVKKVDTKPAEEVKQTPKEVQNEKQEPKPIEPAKETSKAESKKSESVQESVKIVARAPDLEPAKGGGVVESLMQRLSEKQKEMKVDDAKVTSNEKREKESAAPPKVEPAKEIMKDKATDQPKAVIAPKVVKPKEDVKATKAEPTKATSKEVAPASKTVSQEVPAPALKFEDSQLVIAGVAATSIVLATVLVTSGNENESSQPSNSQASSSPPSSSGPPRGPPSAPKPSDASYLNSLNRETAALKNKGQVRGSYLDVIDDTSASARLKGKKSMNSPYLESLPNIKLSPVDAGQGQMPPSAKTQQPPPSQPKAQPQSSQPIPEVPQAMSPPPARTEQAMPPQPIMSESKSEPPTSPPEFQTNSGGYLGALSNPSSGYSPEPKKSFSPMGRKYSAPTSGTGASSYLENMSSRTFSQPPGPSSSSQPQSPAPQQNNLSFDPNGSLISGTASAPPSAPQFGSAPGSSPYAPMNPSGSPPPSGPGGPIKSFSQMGRKYSASQSGTGMGSYLDNISPNGRDGTN